MLQSITASPSPYSLYEREFEIHIVLVGYTKGMILWRLAPHTCLTHTRCSLPPLAAYTRCSLPLFASTGCIYMLLFTPLGPLGRHCKLLLFSLEQYRCGLIIYKIRSIHPLSMIHIRSRNRPLIPPPFQFYAVCPLSFDPDIVHLYLHFNSPIAVHLIPKSSLDLHLFTRISISYLSISVSRRIFNSSLEFTRISISRFSVVNALQWILVDASTQ